MAKTIQQRKSLRGPPHQPASRARLGTGGRFRALTAKIARRGGVRNPRAVAAAIGRSKLGKARFQQLAAAGRRRRR